MHGSSLFNPFNASNSLDSPFMLRKEKKIACSHILTIYNRAGLHGFISNNVIRTSEQPCFQAVDD